MALPNVFDNYNRQKRPSGMTDVVIEQYVVAASTTIYTGDWLKLSGQTVVQAIAAPAAGSATLSGGNLGMIGIALAPIVTDSSGFQTAGGISQNQIPVAILIDDLQAMMRFLGVTSTGAVGSIAFGGTVGLLSELQDITVPGGTYQLGRYTPASGNPWYFISAATSNGELRTQETPEDLQGLTTSEFPVTWVKCLTADRLDG